MLRTKQQLQQKLDSINISVFPEVLNGYCIEKTKQHTFSCSCIASLQKKGWHFSDGAQDFLKVNYTAHSKYSD